MRIVYDDEQLPLFVKTVKDIIGVAFSTQEQMKSVVRHSYGMDRVETTLVKKQLSRLLEPNGFEIGNDVYHENGIGNNSRYPVYYNTIDEKQQVGYINIIDNMYGDVLVYVSDYERDKWSNTYKLSKYGCRVKI